MKCRHCDSPLTHTFLDLGHAPPSNAYLTADDLKKPEIYYPLNVKVCNSCWLVQTVDYTKADELFTSDYAYFSSTSSSWLTHAELYTSKMINELALNSNSFVIEVACNDGYLLRNFVAEKIPCLGIEPTANTAAAAELLGIPVLRNFFGNELGKQLADEGKQADLIIGNNVYAHVPDINDFTLGLKAALKGGGTITLEFPHLMQLIENSLFDTIYHEHFSYLSLTVVASIFEFAELRIWHVEELTTHGGSLRVYGCHFDDVRETNESVTKFLQKEASHGIGKLATYVNFQKSAERIKYDLVTFLINQKLMGNKVAAYGAAAKGNTLINYAGLKPDLLPFVYDAAVSKQKKYMPGSHIPILSPEEMLKNIPDYLLILPWNITNEVIKQYKFLEQSGVTFVTAVPKLVLL